MADDDAKKHILRLQEEARLAYEEFLSRMEALEKERSEIVKTTIKQIDNSKIEQIRKKLGLD